ncbi:MAG: hypothetical protein DRJ03_10010 [Chloroflexi bacterium]|nr:MAG: hypothetical protein DRJ03_10010 [Chloroflexota bacterium]
MREQETLTLRLLGKTQILYGTSSLAEPLATKEQALLIYLACQPDQRFSRDHLATLLWGETSQSRARYNLRRALWHLRQALDQVGLPPEACLITEGFWVYAPSNAPCQVDVRDFEQVLHACFQDPQSQFSPASEGIRRIRKALDLYQGDFLAGFSVLNAPNFEEWLTLERERLFLLLLRTLTSLIQNFIARGARDEAIPVCQRLLVLDPLQEDIHRLLMRLYWETGQRTQALRQYNTYRNLLRRELSIEPLEETRDLYQRILQHESPPTPTTSSLVLTSRLTPPSPSSESLPRPRLSSLLDRGLTVRLTILSAPPGYGKTTLLTQWIENHSQSSDQQKPLFAWYKVNETDNDPLAFVEGLAASVARLHPTTGQTLQDHVHDIVSLQGDTRQAVGLLSKNLALYDPTPFVIVLDDLERLTSSDSRKVLQQLVEHLPANGHLYLLTRIDPDLPLPRLRVRGQLLELRTAELRFTDEEIAAFIKHSPALSLGQDEIAELTTRAEGWIAPLWLAANALSRFASNLDDVWTGIFAYLRDEVLAPQSPQVRAFLLNSAILDQMTPSLCQAVLDASSSAGDIDNSAQWLAELERRNLFLRRITPATISPLADMTGEGTESRYTYHPLFLAFLRTELYSRLSRAEIKAMHRRAAMGWEQQGHLELALFHYQQMGDESAVARLLEQIAPAYLQQGRLEPLARWLDQLEPAVRDQHPRLTLNAGHLRQAEGQVKEARLLYQRAAADFELGQNSTAHGDSLLALAELELLRGHYAEGIELGERALTCWDETDIRRRTAALCTIGQLQARQGNLADAESLLAQAKDLLRSRDQPLLAFQVLRVQAWIAYLRGDYHRTIGLNRLAEHEAGRDVFPELVATFNNPVPAILREWGKGEITWEMTHQRIEAARQIQDRLALSHAYTDLGNLYLDRGQCIEAQESFRQAIAEAEAAGEDGLLRLCGEAHLVYAHFLHGNTQEAAEVAEAALRRCQARAAPPLELAVAQTAAALAHISLQPGGDSDPKNSRQLLDEAYQTFDRLGVRYGAFVSAALLGLAHLTEGRAGNRQQARRYTTTALALAAAEGYTQTIVTSHRVTLPLLRFALREGVESRFVSQILAQIGEDKE